MSSHRQLHSAAVPEQMRTMQMLGFESQGTDDSSFAEWMGHGLCLTLPSDLKLNFPEGVKAIIGAASKLGREQAQAEMRRALGIK
jgi:ribose 1,5-bisphosphokinase PhnN